MVCHHDMQNGENVLDEQRMNSYFLCINSGKKALSLNMADPQGQEIFKKLINNCRKCEHCETDTFTVPDGSIEKNPFMQASEYYKTYFFAYCEKECKFIIPITNYQQENAQRWLVLQHPHLYCGLINFRYLYINEITAVGE